MTSYSLEYSEKHKTILKYQQVMATSTHEKMGFKIQIGDIIISPSPLWAKNGNSIREGHITLKI